MAKILKTSTGKIIKTNNGNIVTGDSGIISDLTGCTWVGNETLTFGSTAKTYDVHFFAGGGQSGEWVSIQITNNIAKLINYESTNVYDGTGTGWDGGTGPESFNTLEFDGEGEDVRNAELIAWLKANGTLTR